MQNEKVKFKVGDYAYKPKGYSFPCQIRAVFTNRKGETRLVAEMIGDNGAGMLHIFNENNLINIFKHRDELFPDQEVTDEIFNMLEKGRKEVATALSKTDLSNLSEEKNIRKIIETYLK